METANETNEENDENPHDLLLNANKDIAISSMERDLKLHNLQAHLKAFKTNNTKLEEEVKELEVVYAKKEVEYDYLTQNLELLEENLQLWKISVKDEEEKVDLTMDVHRLEKQLDELNRKRANDVKKRLQAIMKSKVETLEKAPLAQKRHKLRIQNEKRRIELAILQKNIADQKEKNKIMRNIIKRQEQIKIIKFAQNMVDNKKKQDLKDNKKELKSAEQNNINEKKVLNTVVISNQQAVTIKDTVTSVEPMQIDQSKYQNELSDISKHLQRLSARPQSPKSPEEINFVIPQIRSSFSGMGDKLLNSLKKNRVIYNKSVDTMKANTKSLENNVPTDKPKYKSELSELAKLREKITKKPGLLQNTSFISSGSHKPPKQNFVSSITPATTISKEKIISDLPNQGAPPAKKCKLDTSQSSQPDLNKTITKNLSQNTQKNLATKQLNLSSNQSQFILKNKPKITQKTDNKNLSQTSNPPLSQSQLIPKINPKTTKKTDNKNLSQNSNPPLTPAKTNPRPLSQEKPNSQKETVKENSQKDSVKRNSQKQVEQAEITEKNESFVKSSYFPIKTNESNLNNSTSTTTSQMPPSTISTQDSEMRLSSDTENQQNNGQQLSPGEEHLDILQRLGQDEDVQDKDYRSQNPYVAEDFFGLNETDMEIEMPNFSPSVPNYTLPSPPLLSPPNIVESEKEVDQSNESNNSSFVLNFGKPQKNSSFFSMF